MSWASRRKFKYFFVILIIVFVIAIWFVYPLIFKKTSCFDGKQNGNEAGIDCGGSCVVFCQSEVSLPVVLWSRAFPVTANIHNLVAVVENQNKDAALEKVSYEFRVYDDNNKLIGRKEGKTYLPPNQQFIIFEPRFDGAQAKVKSVSFELLPPYNWIRKAPILQTFPVFVDSIVLENYESTPTLKARITNESVYSLPEFDIMAILYDENHNAINASKTHKEGLASNESTQAFFSWMLPFSSRPVTEEVTPQINPFSVSF